jgi:membrane associated rhomboid family serine protease
MFLPLRDDNPRTVTPYVNYGIIAACVAVYFWQSGLSDRDGERAVYAYGLIPGALFGKVLVPHYVHRLPGLLTIFTSMFMHGGWLHLLGNMWFLWIFGHNVEDALGHRRYLVFYLLCGTAAAAAQIFSGPYSDMPMIGASGAISGVLGAYFVLTPRANVKVLVLLIIFFTVINMPAFIVLGFWFVMQLLSQAMSVPGEGGVAFAAHIGGFIAGAMLVFFFRRRAVAIFQPRSTPAFAMERRPIMRRRIPDAGRRGPWDI